MPASEITAMSVVPPPMSTIMNKAKTTLTITTYPDAVARASGL